MKTSSWSTPLPDTHQRIGISRGAPRRMAAGYRLYKKLAPGSWFNSVGPEEYYDLYRKEILAPLDPRIVAQELQDLAPGRIPTLLCFERPGSAEWCHRAMAAEWLAQALGTPVPEYGHETLPQHLHPMMPAQLRKPEQPVLPLTDDITPYIGRTATIDAVPYTVVGPDSDNRSLVVIADPTNGIILISYATLRKYFKPTK